MDERVKLDGLLAARCYAALTIALFHMIWLPRLELPGYLSFIGTYGRLGVPLFYVVSAFSLLIGYSAKLHSRDEIVTYFVRRFTRIAPLFYVLIAIHVVLLGRFFGKPAGMAEIASSLLFVFNFVPQHVTGFVLASWSIGVEMAFYLIFPILALTVTDWKRAAALVLLCLYLNFMWQAAFAGAPAGLVMFGKYFFLTYMPYFATGFVAFQAWQAARRSPHSSAIGAAALGAGLLGAIATMAYGTWIGVDLDYRSQIVLWPVILGAVTIGVALYPTRLLVGPATKALGEASFSLYLWHPLVIVAYIKAGTYKAIYAHVADHGLAFAACAAVTIATLCAVAIPSYRYIERPGTRLAVRFRRA